MWDCNEGVWHSVGLAGTASFPYTAACRVGGIDAMAVAWSTTFP